MNAEFSDDFQTAFLENERPLEYKLLIFIDDAERIVKEILWWLVLRVHFVHFELLPIVYW